MIKMCPACNKNSYDFLSCDKDRYKRFVDYSNIKYGGLLHSWTDLQPALSKCSECSHIFYKDMPSDSRLSEIYSSAIRDQNSKDPSRSPSNHMIQTMERIFLISKKKKPVLLDYGSGYGRWSEAAAQVGFTTISFEPNSTRSSNNINYHLISDKTKLNHYQYDVIWLEQVMEHVKDPYDLLLGIFDLMKKNSILIITVPNINRAEEGDKIWIDWPYGGKNNHTLAPYQHLHGFNQNSLQKLVKRAGFKNIISKELLLSDPLHFMRLCIGGMFPKLSTTRCYLQLQ